MRDESSGRPVSAIVTPVRVRSGDACLRRWLGRAHAEVTHLDDEGLPPVGGVGVFENVSTPDDFELVPLAGATA